VRFQEDAEKSLRGCEEFRRSTTNFTKTDSCGLDVVGMKYNFSQSLAAGLLSRV